ncbi:2-succinylbenzoate--CoA ligase [Phormidium sp. FACHB-592]|uniref:2-succinylbenzoate--CoA ligase n=1 Tax=Stenomitos frigidus AS-A4 TaxID=2933935 RepID=A0ABV0KF00_9CYAN|nr:2-succinylbenzoate--CoA ligase [Phormidium sp. FACHB-592]MBD2076402.1 2-succinylbenzoate--CoA ligase [Phormidium sp. FACHB-592]
MADPLTILKQRSRDDWLVGYDSQEFFALAERVLVELRSPPNSEAPLTILLADRNPLTFLAHFIAACAANCCIVLANPDWTKAEWQQVFELVQPDLVWGEEAKVEGRRQRAGGRRQKAEGKEAASSQQRSSASPNPLLPQPPVLTPHILIPTGGTSGKIRFAVHTWETLMVSVEGFREYFEVEPINSFCVLPLYHVSGLMQFMRSFTTGGKLVVLPFKALEAGDRSNLNPEEFFLSLVPTQLQRLLDGESRGQKAAGRRQETQHSTSLLAPDSSIAWLARFHTVLLGGAPAWSELLDRARSQRIRLAPTYGMTETASQIATLKPDDFLNGQTNAGHVLPHAQLTIRNPSGDILKTDQIGNITIQAKSLAWSYFPPTPHSPLPTPRSFQPDDLGYFDANGYLHIVGRQSDKIITGGENVFPAEVEAAIRSTGLVQDVCVIGISDRHWGQAITAVYIPISADISPTSIQTALSDTLSKFKRPKHWLAVDRLPRNAQGKVNRPQVEAIAKMALPTVLAID